mgnify:CR=1 FL=1
MGARSSTLDSTERIPILQKPVESPLTSRTKLACTAILVAESLERLCYYSLQGNLVFFLSKVPLCWKISLAVYAQLVLSGVMYTTGLLAGWLSDSYLRRYTVIVMGYCIYIIGYAYLPVLGYYTKVNGSLIHEFNYHEGTSCNNDSEVVGTLALCSDASSTSGFTCSTPVFVALTLIGIGSGAVRTNLAPFGGFQVGFSSHFPPSGTA